MLQPSGSKTESFWKTQTYGRPYITHFFHVLITRELHYNLADVEERAPEKRSIVVKAKTTGKCDLMIIAWIYNQKIRLI